MPNRKEPLTEDVILHIINKANDEDNDNGIYHAIVNWLIMDIQSGYRKNIGLKIKQTLIKR